MDIAGMTLERTEWGKVEFLQSVNISFSVNLNPPFTSIADNEVSVNKSSVPFLDLPARISLYNLTFLNPVILRDSSPCSSSICEFINYSNGNLLFNVTGFSVYSATGSCSDGTLYGQCSSSKPLYCQGGSLVNRAGTCGCPSGQEPDGNDCVDENGGDSCLLPGTQILLTDRSSKPIEQIMVGDSVMSFDPGIGMFVWSRVFEIESPIRNDYYIISFRDGSILRITDEHPVYSRSNGEEGWASIIPEKAMEDSGMTVGQLHEGDEVLSSTGSWVEIAGIEHVEERVQTYNLKRVSNTNTFFAGGFLVHNKGGGPVCTNGDQISCSRPDVCTPSYQTCVGGFWGACEGPAPETEVCDGLDNDCDGDIDNGISCLCEHGNKRSCGPSTDLGVCTYGVSECVLGEWTECIGSTMPQIEICDEVDNDCDGEVDEQCATGLCMEGAIPSEGCICGNDIRDSGFCCSGLFYEEGCPFPFSLLIYAGVIILILLYIIVLYLDSKGQELTWELLRKKMTQQ
jgi:hypothetical protein